MTATIRAVTQANSAAATSTTFTPALPAGTVAGDLLIGIACNGGGAVPTARPSGSTVITSVPDGALFYMDIVRKVAVGGDVFTWTVGTAQRWAGCLIAITTGTYDTTTPIAGASGLAQGSASTTFTTPSSTPTSADSLIIASFGAQATNTWSTTNTAPTMTEICDTAASGTSPASCGVYRSNAPPSVALMSRSAVSTVSTGNGARHIMFVNPGAGGGATGPPILVMAAPSY